MKKTNSNIKKFQLKRKTIRKLTQSMSDAFIAGTGTFLCNDGQSGAVKCVTNNPAEASCKTKYQTCVNCNKV